MKNYVLSSLGALLLAFLTGACIGPVSSGRYLDTFEHFVSGVEKNGSKFNETDWKWANKKFSRLTGEWYDEFREELSTEEKLRVVSLKARYLAAKGKSMTGRLSDENLRDDLKKLREDTKKYLDEDLREDMEELKRGAREIGDSAVKVVEEVLEEIRKK